MRKRAIKANAEASADTISNGNTAPKGIPIEDIISYRAKGLSCEDIATLTGCTKQNVAIRLQDADLEGLDKFKEYKDQIFEHTQRKLVKSLSKDKLNSMSGLQLITGAAILQDKIQVIRGQASDIVEHRTINASLDEITERMRQAGMLPNESS